MDCQTGDLARSARRSGRKQPWRRHMTQFWRPGEYAERAPARPSLNWRAHHRSATHQYRCGPRAARRFRAGRRCSGMGFRWHGLLERPLVRQRRTKQGVCRTDRAALYRSSHCHRTCRQRRKSVITDKCRRIHYRTPQAWARRCPLRGWPAPIGLPGGVALS